MCVWGKSHGLEIECQGGVVWTWNNIILLKLIKFRSKLKVKSSQLKLKP
jgi:hypothetical protein